MTMPTQRLLGPAVLAATLTLISAASAPAQTPSLAGKTVQMIIGFGAGGGYDLWGRVVARHIGKHLPGNPTVVPQNMPGAGSFVAANNIYNVAPKDGTVIGHHRARRALGPLTGAAGRALRSDQDHLARHARPPRPTSASPTTPPR